jgi:serine/threonine protein kinase
VDPKAPESIHARVGTVLCEKWELGEVIGAGGTAAVYEGTHRTNGRRVAIKVLHSDLASSDEVVARFRREGYIANKVGHSGAVDILDDGTTEDGAPFLVMERLDGAPLTHLLDRKKDGLEVGPALRIAHEVLGILAAAHEKEILHRDIKPDNVFLTVDGRVMLLDFGIARLHERSWREGAWESGAGGEARDSSVGSSVQEAARTQEGFALGTPLYMPPEQARGRWGEVDVRSDLWSVGAVMFRLLTGRPLRTADSPADMLVLAMTDRAPRIADVAPRVPPDVAVIVDRALEFAKTDRWPDAKSMQAAIRDVAARLASTRAPAPAGAGEPRASAPAARMKKVLPAAGLLLAGLVALAYTPRATHGPAAHVAPVAVASTTTASAFVPLPVPAPTQSPAVVNTIDVSALPAAPAEPAPPPRRPHRRAPPAAAPSIDPDAPSVLDRRH